MSKKVMVSADNGNCQETTYAYAYGAAIEYEDGSVEEISDQDLEAMLPFGYSLQDFIKSKEIE